MSRHFSSWYFNQNLKPQGPFTDDEIRLKIISGEIGTNELICNELNEWKPASQWEIFELKKCTESIQTGGVGVQEDPSQWVLLVKNQQGLVSDSFLQEGPFTTEEITILIEAGGVSPQQYIWKNGLGRWYRVNECKEFEVILNSMAMRPEVEL
jgi:hypothetical protein